LSCGDAAISNSENADWILDVLELLFAGIFKGDVVEFVSHMSVGIVGKTYTAGLRDAFEASGHNDCVAKDIAGILDNIADVDADPKFNALISWYVRIAFGHATLNFDCATYRIHNAVELSQQPVTGIFDDDPTMASNIWGKQVLQMFPQPCMRAFFVGTGQSAITSNIGRQNRYEPSHELIASQGLSPR
jgi:hypothetical protein